MLDTACILLAGGRLARTAQLMIMTADHCSVHSKVLPSLLSRLEVRGDRQQVCRKSSRTVSVTCKEDPTERMR